MADDLNAVVEAVETLRAALISGGSVLYAGRAGFALARSRPSRAMRRESPAGTFSDQVIVVRVENDGGSPGDLNTNCSFTYKIWDNYADYLVDPPLAEQLAPAQIRLPNTKYVAANANSRGLAFYDTEASLWRLLYCFRERPDVGDCSV